MNMSMLLYVFVIISCNKRNKIKIIAESHLSAAALH